MRRRLNSRACDPFDEWLDSLGLCRKQVARDGSCLFRAVAEQVFLTQTEHVRVRSLCLQYMLQHKEDFQPFLDMPLDHYVYNLHDMREWGGHLEIMSMSRLFKRNFIIYREIGQEPYKVTDIEGKSLMLSFTHGNHYDIVYKKEDASLRGFCQSVVYDILYSHVFKLTDVRLAVDTMLHDKEYANLRRDSSNSAELKEIGALVEKIIGVNVSRDSQDGDEKNESSEEKVSANDIHPDDVRGLLTHGIPPFSYKVAKALDPDLYRNIEFDTWNTVRREARYGPFDYNGFQAGVKVLIKRDLLPDHLEIEKIKPGNSENGDGKAEQKCSVFHGHIQEMAENKGPVDVYIEELGRRLKVPYESLERVPPTPPCSPWHSHVQPHIHGSGGVPTPPGGGGMPAYKNLSGYYQKAPLPPENEFSVGKGKKKGAKPMRDSLPSAGRYGSSQNSGMRGRSYGSPVGMGHSPRARIPQGYSQNNFHRNSHNRGIGRAREDFPAFFNSSSSAAPGVDGVWAARPSGNQQLASSTPKSNNSSAHYALSPPPLCEDQSKVQVQSVTEALQQVMSAGGQEVRITGQQLEVVNNPDNDFVDEQASARLQGNYGYECDLTSAQGDVEVDKAATAGLTNHTPVAINEAEPVVSHPSEELYAPSPHPDVDPNMIYFSTASGTQIGCPSQNSDMYTVTFPPPYVSSAYVQMVSPATSDGTYTPCEYPTSSTVDQGRPDSVDGMSQSSDQETMKMNPRMTSVMVYQVPVMYSGYGYGYNQPYTYVPVIPSPNSEDGATPPLPGAEMYQHVVPPCGWVPGFMGEMMPPPVPHFPLPPPQNVPPFPREPPVPQYPPPPHFSERPSYHHHHRGRGRGFRPNFHNRWNYHNEYTSNSYYESGPRGGGYGQRPLPPRFYKGGGGPPSGHGGPPRYPPPHVNNPPPSPNFHRNLQYEGQPLMQMGSRKSSSESISSQVVTGSNVSSGGVASPPMSYPEPDRPPGVVAVSAQNVLPLPPPQDAMAYYSNPQGYVMSGPWMWKMM